MKGTVILLFEETKFIINESEFRFIYPYLYRFGKKTELDLANKTSFPIQDEQLLELKRYIGMIINDFLEDCYIAPSEKELSKHGMRYTKVNYNMATYRLWASLRNPSDLLIYSQLQLLDLLQLAYEKKEKVLLLIEEVIFSN